jgi:hypothetical protein
MSSAVPYRSCGPINSPQRVLLLVLVLHAQVQERCCRGIPGPWGRSMLHVQSCMEVGSCRFRKPNACAARHSLKFPTWPHTRFISFQVMSSLLLACDSFHFKSNRSSALATWHTEYAFDTQTGIGRDGFPSQAFMENGMQIAAGVQLALGEGSGYSTFR